MKSFYIGVLAYALTLLTGGIWSLLVTANLKITPSIPWSALVMGLLLWAIWHYFASGHRKRLARANPISKNTLGIAFLAGIFSLTALTGLWIVLSQLVKIPGNITLNTFSYPWFTVAITFIMASLVGAITEEIGFRGYFQGTLESKMTPAISIIITALIMFPAHGLTQGFLWPILLFYFVVDATFGTMAYLTNSIMPGIVVHAIGLFIFFMFIWPMDATRTLVFQNGADIWFWTHLAQTIIFAVAAMITFKQLARTKKVGY